MVSMKTYRKFTYKNALSLYRGCRLKLKTRVGKMPIINGKCNIQLDGELNIGDNISIRADPFPAGT